ncbi:transcription factor bHLH149-like [Phoenix dactylifera]|uniref:Transcription factor bHLH149-like n=1 Tax=Phoenix dactylifera TaxID=42345 RepID=A0A8B7CEP9_PHODC|nr:transcription factor bHLH149-like [Phoenix dactylifera]
MEKQDSNRSLSFIDTPTAANAGFLERGRRIKMAAEMGLVESSRGRHWSRALRSRLLRRKGNGACGCKEEGLAPCKVAEDLVGEDGDDEVIEIERRVRALQKLVPGGEDLAMDQLFEETADYIEALQGQVNVMRALAGLLDGLEKEKRLMGG